MAGRPNHTCAPSVTPDTRPTRHVPKPRIVPTFTTPQAHLRLRRSSQHVQDIAMFDKDLIFMPINITNTHWTLIAMDMLTKTIVGMGSSTSTMPWPTCEPLLKPEISPSTLGSGPVTDTRRRRTRHNPIPLTAASMSSWLLTYSRPGYLSNSSRSKLWSERGLTSASVYGRL